MPTTLINSIRVHYEDTGSGDAPVLMIMGTGSGGQPWHLHQVPALAAAGHRVITVTNRGIPPTDECADGFTVMDMAADAIALIEHLDLPPTHVIGTSLGARIAAETALARPDLTDRLVLLAACARDDRMRLALSAAEREMQEAGIVATPAYRAAVKALTYLSPTTLAQDTTVGQWLELFELYDGDGTAPGVLAQERLQPLPARLNAYAALRAPTKVISFADDLVTPPHLGAELAAAIRGAQYEVIPDCGHFGYLERPEAVNRSILTFLGTAR
ncbi:alpha/beta fold hydrolase [Streptomyces sp. NPDC087300]|uniref:alpha/beta fold hydrolase n=1 Tax=Streptomyces sp. NPDC087300 TaxID=3365780 RepID=UPI0037F56065